MTTGFTWRRALALIEDTAMHENYRKDLPLLAKCGAAQRYMPLKRRTKVIQRFERYSYNYRPHIHSIRIVKPWGRTSKTKLRAWDNADRTFIHLACGINPKVNRFGL